MADEERPVIDASSTWFARTKALVVAGAKEFGADSAGRLAAALAYYTLFSLVPFLFLAVAVSTITLGPAETELPERCESMTEAPLGDQPLDRVVAEVDRVAGSAVSEPVRVILCGARKSAPASLSIGLALAIFSASGIFIQAQGVLNFIFGAPEEKVSGVMGIIRQRAIGFLSATVLAVLVLVPVIAVGLIQFAKDLLPATLSWLSPVLTLVVPIVSLGLLVGVVAATFQALTAQRIPGKAAIRGGAVTALIGLVAAFLVGTYLGRGAGTGTLGVLGGLAILLLFFNLMWTVYLFGAEVTKVYTDYLEFGDIVQPSERADGLDAHAAPPRRPEVSPQIGFGAAAAMVVGMIIGRLGGRKD